jgi:glycosyltransferase involved in cell wall biosynthesis
VCERKGLIDLRDALRSLRSEDGRLPFRTLVAGDGTQEGPGAFERTKQAYDDVGLRDVEFLGAVTPERLRVLLAAASVFCLPSHWEGFPLAILEAMASRAAVVATSVGDIPHILDHGRAGALVSPHDPAGLAEVLGTLARDPEERRRLGKLGRERVERKFRLEIVVRELAELYLGLTGRRR